MHAETRIQIAVVKWWSLACKGYGLDERVLFHVPNGGKRRKKEASILKAMGVRPGVPDLLLIVPRGNSVGLALEMKAPDGRVSKPQQEMQTLFLAANWATAIAWSTQDGIDSICRYLKTGNPDKV